ncbi:MAG: 50S ribosome-binding GTPase, partial [Gemmatimonadota bacterium]|nr:50S ribosome-binding GTPase [Gemmatimonadota bacterium]
MSAAPPAGGEAAGGDLPLVALVGPPNSGKSTLFNNLTGLRQRVANYPGVTVERRSGVAGSATGPVEVIDLPGVHGLSPRSPDQAVTRNALLGEMEGDRRPDAVVAVLDATRLRSHLMVAEPVLGLGLPTLVALTMADELDRRDGALRSARLSRELGVEVALVNARDGATLEPVRRFLAALRTGGEEVRACPVAGAPPPPPPPPTPPPPPPPPP